MVNRFETSPEIAHALAGGGPVVALESTLISHGMPWPQNAHTATLLEQTVRDAGALPATIAILNGAIKVGLAPEEIDLLARAGRSAHKTSRRDIAWVCSQKRHGATTVAATMLIAHMAGIRIFATGGIGGVHRGGAQTFDISADLRELSQTPVAVVCAGAKSILDLPLTLEYLETAGVPVAGYQTREFPAFFSRKSGLPLDIYAQNPEEIAQLLHEHWRLPMPSGVVVANPIPEDAALDFADMENVIEEALAEAHKQQVQGKNITPFLLARIEQKTAGASLNANIQLALNNARLAAQIARAYARLT